MLDILSVTAPIFLLLGVGYWAVLGGILGKAQVQGLGTFVIHFALPALIVRALIQHPLDEVLNVYYLLAYGLGSATVFVAALLVARLVQGKSLAAGALYAMGMATANSGFIGYPVVALLIGSPAGIALSLNLLVENLLIIPAALALAEAGLQRGNTFGDTLRRSLLRLTRNPIIIAILIGISLAVSGITLPVPLLKAIDMLATASAPVALFVIGGTLYGLRPRGMMSDVGQIAFGKLVLHPLAVLLLFLLLPPIDPALTVAGVVIASAPMISIYPLFGQRYGHSELCTAALLVSTLLSFITISALIWGIGSLGLLSPGE